MVKQMHLHNAGSVNSLGEHIIVKEGMRNVSIVLNNSIEQFQVHEDDDLRQKSGEVLYRNAYSFKELFEKVNAISAQEYQEQRDKARRNLQ